MMQADSTRAVRWGVISTAKIGREQVIPAIKASRNGYVAAIASRDADKARAFAAELGIERSYDSYEALLADPEIDAIYNPLPNDGHAPWSIAAIKAGKHVLVEKPMAMDAAETRTMIDAAQAAKVLLAEAFMYRFHPQHARVRELIAAGDIGQPNLISAEFTYAMAESVTDNVRLKPELGGGGLWDVGCYCVNAIRLISGREPQSVSGYAVVGRSGVDESFVGILRLPDGMLAHFACGMRSHNTQQYVISGTNGSITVDLPFRPDDNSPTLKLIRHDQTTLITVPVANQYVLMVEDFAAAILDKRAPRYSAEDGYQNMRVLDALAQSAREGRQVAL